MKRIIGKFVAFVQKILIGVFLIFLYIFGFGATALLFKIFGLRFSGGRDDGSDTSWRDTDGYGSDMGDCLRES